MDATLVVIDSDTELARARALVDSLITSDNPDDIARLAAQARISRPSEVNCSVNAIMAIMIKVSTTTMTYWPSIRLSPMASENPGSHGGSVCGSGPNTTAFGAL